MASRLPFPGADPPRARVLAAVARAGTLGITSKQLSHVTQLTGEQVSRHLERLAGRNSVARLGRGLWVLDEHRVLAPDASVRFTRAFEREFHLRVGNREGPIQFRRNEMLPVHRWWPYVQGFSAEFVEEVCQQYQIGKGSTVLDPFCGSGTVPTVARRLGARPLGMDKMPIAAFVSSAKQEWSVDPDRLLALARRCVRDRTRSSLPRPFLRETTRHFSPGVLASLLRLKENIGTLKGSPAKTLLRLAFASILIESSQLHRSPCLGYARGKRVDPGAPYALFLAAVKAIAQDLRDLHLHRGTWGPRGRILTGDSGTVDWPEASVDLAITSPPYVNGMDYVMNYKIDLAWLDFVHSYEELAALRASMVACDNIPRGTASSHAPTAEIQGDDWIGPLVRTIERNIREKGSYRREDMGAVVTKYFDDLVPVIRNVFRTLRPGGRFVVVNGDSLIAGAYIPGDLLFARLASSAGFLVERVEVARNRRSGQRRSFVLRESVVTLRKPGPGTPTHDAQAARARAHPGGIGGSTPFSPSVARPGGRVSSFRARALPRR